MKSAWLISRIVLINLIFCQICMAKSIFDPLWSYFSRPSHEDVYLREFKLAKNGTIILKNSAGDISIKEWNQDTVNLMATKQAYSPGLLARTTIDAHEHESGLTITTKRAAFDDTTLVQYELIVPQNAKLQVSTGKGSINIDKLKAPVQATTKEGIITINDTKAAVDAVVHNGEIIIKNSQGNVRAETDTGDITIFGARHTIVAKTKSGSINATCASIPSLDTVLLNTQSGDIHLALPRKTNADLQARTGKGTLTCDHYVTIKPQAVQLNKKTWSRFKKEVAGTIGTGEATIKLSTGAGNIKITQATT